jgi:hypothetical protein
VTHKTLAQETKKMRILSKFSHGKLPIILDTSLAWLGQD